MERGVDMAELNIGDLNRPTIDFIILADRAEVLNGKLYMMGGGWERLNVRDFAQPQTIGCALGVIVPWNATNQRHSLTLRIETEDRAEVAGSHVEAAFTTGRPALLEDAQPQRVTFAVGRTLILPGPGQYRVVVTLNDDQERQGTTFFRAVMAPGRPVQ